MLDRNIQKQFHFTTRLQQRHTNNIQPLWVQHLVERLLSGSAQGHGSGCRMKKKTTWRVTLVTVAMVPGICEARWGVGDEMRHRGNKGSTASCAASPHWTGDTPALRFMYTRPNKHPHQTSTDETDAVSRCSFCVLLSHNKACLWYLMMQPARSLFFDLQKHPQKQDWAGCLIIRECMFELIPIKQQWFYICCLSNCLLCLQGLGMVCGGMCVPLPRHSAQSSGLSQTPGSPFLTLLVWSQNKELPGGKNAHLVKHNLVDNHRGRQAQTLVPLSDCGQVGVSVFSSLTGFSCHLRGRHVVLVLADAKCQRRSHHTETTYVLFWAG